MAQHSRQRRGREGAHETLRPRYLADVVVSRFQQQYSGTRFRKAVRKCTPGTACAHHDVCTRGGQGTGQVEQDIQARRAVERPPRRSAPSNTKKRCESIQQRAYNRRILRARPGLPRASMLQVKHPETARNTSSLQNAALTTWNEFARQPSPVGTASTAGTGVTSGAVQCALIASSLFAAASILQHPQHHSRGHENTNGSGSGVAETRCSAQEFRT